MDEARKKITLKYLQQKKLSKRRITSIGVYDSPMAAISDRIGFDLLIIGNAGPMSLFGHKDPTTVKFEEQLFMTQAVSRVTKYGFIVAHLPYLSYHLSKEDAIRNAGRMVSEGGADAVKCEGNKHTAEYIAVSGIVVELWNQRIRDRLGPRPGVAVGAKLQVRKFSRRRRAAR